MFSSPWKVVSILSFLICCGTVPAQSVEKQTEFNDDNWEELVSGEWFLQFAAKWCKNCKALQPEWDKLPAPVNSLGIKMAKVDVLKSPKLTERFAVKKVPAIFYLKNGEIRQYQGVYKAKALYSFLADKLWENVVPLSVWKNPSLIRLSFLSQMFKMSELINDYGSYLKSEYGIPIWGGYFLLSIGTVIISLTLGIISVTAVEKLNQGLRSGLIRKLEIHPEIQKVDRSNSFSVVADENNEIPAEDTAEDIDKTEESDIEKLLCTHKETPTILKKDDSIKNLLEMRFKT